MKYSKAQVHRKTHGLPALRFEDSQLTSFSGLILLQARRLCPLRSLPR
jgi:hypothetical protein